MKLKWSQSNLVHFNNADFQALLKADFADKMLLEENSQNFRKYNRRTFLNSWTSEKVPFLHSHYLKIMVWRPSIGILFEQAIQIYMQPFLP